MRILLDENLDWRLRRDVPGHDVQSVPLLGWAGVKNGELLRRAVKAGFQILVTMDKGIPFERNLRGLQLALVRLQAPTNRLEDTRPLMPLLLACLPDLKPGLETVLHR